MTPVVAALIAATGALAGWRAGWLTPGAALAATAVGAAVGAGGGIPGLACLAMFFVSSSLLSGRDVAGSRRGAVQVLANGWAAAAGGLLTAVAPTAGWGLMVGGLAAAQADTWATEWGRRSARPPRMITTGRPVLVGTSGAVSLPGTAGGVAGAATLALLAWMLGLPVPAPWMAGAGIAGMLVDSVLGATVQARRTCTVCGRAVEWPRHCDAATTRVGGFRWVTNDTVNALATGAGAAIAACAAVGWQMPG